jgi:hypothetical protein
MKSDRSRCASICNGSGGSTDAKSSSEGSSPGLDKPKSSRNVPKHTNVLKIMKDSK